MPTTSYLAFDLGASSGRAGLGTLVDDRLQMTEVPRQSLFPTPLAEREEGLTWHLDTLWNEVKSGLVAGLERAPDLRAVSVDPCAVDYVPLGGTPLRDPYCSRATRSHGRMAAVLSRVPTAEIYRRTGIQRTPSRYFSP